MQHLNWKPDHESEAQGVGEHRSWLWKRNDDRESEEKIDAHPAVLGYKGAFRSLYAFRRR